MGSGNKSGLRQSGGSDLLSSDRRSFLRTGALAVASALVPSIACGPNESPRGGSRRPNILFIITDDQRYESIGYAEGSVVRTPHLDRIAASGMIFDAAYCNALTCNPSRGSIMSGLHWHRFRHANKSKSSHLLAGEWTWAHALRANGYRTGLVGKMHFTPMRAVHGFEHTEYCEHQFSRVIPRGMPFHDDYERWLSGFGLKDPHQSMQLWPHDARFHPISWVRDRSIAYLEASKRASEPFCLTASFRYPHPPFDPPRSFAQLYDPRSIEVPTDAWRDMENLPPRLARLDGKGWFPRESKTVNFLRRRFSHYYALITQIDDAVGSIMEHVDLANTLVIFTSDHGVYLGHRGRIDKEPFVPFDDIARVPLFACGYGVPAGRRVANPVGLVDLAPTFLAAAGIEVPEPLDGIPLQNYFDDPTYGADRSVYCTGLTMFNMLRRGQHKYFQSHDHTESMLFDLTNDPRELRNLARDPHWSEAKGSLAEQYGEVQGRVESDLPRFPIA
jgi:arylsulfatase